METNGAKPKIGDRIKIIHGGDGARCANGETGIVIEKPFRRPTDYGGELWENQAELYVREDIYGAVFGLCAGYKIDLIVNSIPKETFPAREEWFDQLIDLAADYLECPSPRYKISQEPELKEKILSITYDKISELLTRVEEQSKAIENALTFVKATTIETGFMVKVKRELIEELEKQIQTT